MIKSRITLKQLEAFVCVVDFGTFRKAADVLGTTQPNISARISSLEDSLGVLLMHRDAGSIRLTEKGISLLGSARKILWASEEFLETAERQDLITERLRLGVTELVACSWLHDFLRQFRIAYPSVIVELQVNLSVEIEKELSAGQIDLALQTGPFLHESTASLSLASYAYVWVAAPDLAAGIGRKPGLARLLQSPVLTHARHSQVSRELSKRVESCDLPSDRIVYSSSLSSCIQMAIDSMGFALLPEVLVRDAIRQKRLKQINSDWLPSELELHARYDRNRAPRFVQAAAECALETARQTPA
ncbi:LysR family transcriptional regulator [Granulosicoccus sp. 3-233]|uniref:LysR family transcriptional regulator n=1 Tax=Granulosicoccus sp. 3-233 TaxID=3417969 RepID=UPI003D3511CD